MALSNSWFCEMKLSLVIFFIYCLLIYLSMRFEVLTVVCNFFRCVCGWLLIILKCAVYTIIKMLIIYIYTNPTHIHEL